MDAAHRGETALAASDYPSAITHYTTAINSSPNATTYYIKRSIAYQRTGDFTSALHDAEIAVVGAHKRAKRELIAQAQLRRGIALYHLGKFGDALFLFEVAKRLDEKDKSFGMWVEKGKLKMKGLEDGDEARVVGVKELPDLDVVATGATAQKEMKTEEKNNLNGPAANAGATLSTTNGNGAVAAWTQISSSAQGAQTPADKIRHEWYQNEANVFLSILAKGVPKDRTSVDIERGTISISFPLASGSQYDFSLDPLFAAIDPASSSFRILGTKIELTLKKIQPGVKWPALEGTVPVASEDNNTTSSTDDATRKAVNAAATATTASTGPVYPTSARGGPKNWDKIVNSFAKPSKSESTKSSISKKTAASDDSSGDETSDEVPTKSTEKGKGKAKTTTDDDYIDFEDEGGDDVNKFFKQLYKGASDETRRAMMKSYQESGGTALSTNWEEVKKGPVPISPPDGMEAKKWEI